MISSIFQETFEDCYSSFFTSRMPFWCQTTISKYTKNKTMESPIADKMCSSCAVVHLRDTPPQIDLYFFSFNSKFNISHFHLQSLNSQFLPKGARNLKFFLTLGNTDTTDRLIEIISDLLSARWRLRLCWQLLSTSRHMLVVRHVQIHIIIRHAFAPRLKAIRFRYISEFSVLQPQCKQCYNTRVCYF